MKYRRMYIQKFRKFLNVEFSFGSKITVISGLNGIGKSSLLSLISSTTGTSDKRLNSQPFQPEFTDYFNLSRSEKIKDYKLYLEFDKTIKNQNGNNYFLTKRISFRNDTKSSRGIRVLPRATGPIDNDVKVSQEQAKEDAKRYCNITDSKRIQIPTIYLSLGRLLPMGETELESKKISSTTNIIKNGYVSKFIEYYNAVLPGSIELNEEEVNFLRKKITGKKRLDVHLKGIPLGSESVGQDNLSNIISAIIDFYALKYKLGQKYKGGMLCIDEIDASLHPSAVVRLFDLLNNLTKDLNLQIVVTSHSLTILKKIISLQNSDPEKYRLAYFKDQNSPYIEKFATYYLLKADLFDQISFNRPKIKIYCEDEFTVSTFSLLIDTARNLGLFGNDDYDVMKISLGKDHLKKLPEIDNYFKTVVIVLDGDARLKKKINNDEALHQDNFEEGKKTTNPRNVNIVFLPSFTPPEIYLYKIVKEYANNSIKHSSFWRSLDDEEQKNSLLTSSRIQSNFKTDSKELNFDELHDNGGTLAKGVLAFATKTKLLTDYYSNEETLPQLKEFIKHINNALTKVSNLNAAKKF
ncbi:MAG: AAA family ATPase [Liquorilactobacillus nagelii]|uniref:AAA family ATPase n=1 Tax=Liquorilactobacillus nagelii TaxID=82688 RepID=UPI0039EBB346